MGEAFYKVTVDETVKRSQGGGSVRQTYLLADITPEVFARCASEGDSLVLVEAEEIGREEAEAMSAGLVAAGRPYAMVNPSDFLGLLLERAEMASDIDGDVEGANEKVRVLEEHIATLGGGASGPRP